MNTPKTVQQNERVSFLSKSKPSRFLLIVQSLFMASTFSLAIEAYAGPTGPSQPGINTPAGTKTGGDKPNCGGMPTYTVDAPLISLRIEDTPIGCHSPIGPQVKVTLSYTQNAGTQPATQNFTNVGPNWYLNWVSYIQDNPQSIGSSISRVPMGGGSVSYRGTYNAATGLINPDGLTVGSKRDQLYLVSTNPIRYELRSASGSKEIFTWSDGAASSPRRVFMTQKVDPRGNAVNLSYDALNRIVSVTDAIGRVTTLQYNHATNNRLVTDIYDPYARHAQVSYDASGRVSAITDVIGMQSSFTYGNANFITAMTTPYGKTTFAFGGSAPNNWLNATGPLGNTERTEFNQGVGVANSDPQYPNLTPYGVNANNAWLNYRDVFFWDKAVYKKFPGDYTKAHIHHFLHDGGSSQASGILESKKKPLDNRELYTYPNPVEGGIRSGTSDLPWLTSRVMPDGTTAITALEYNSLGNVTSRTDPLGRKTLLTYAADGTDVLSIAQKTPSGQDTLLSFTWNSQHLPLTVTDASGGTTSYTYNSRGQTTQMVNAKGEATSYSYDGNGFLLSATNANGQTQVSFTYDGFGRVATMTDSEGHTQSFTYDALDRIVGITYPDGSSRVYVWDKLDVVSETDRLGRTTTFNYDAERNLKSVTDPQGLITRYGYDEAGRMISLTDPAGSVTTWTRDIQGRITAKTYSDGKKDIYVYDTADRLRDTTDGRNQTVRRVYAKDSRLAGLQYLNAAVTTPNVSFTDDAVYPRVKSMVDGQGMTHYTYVAVGSPGGGAVASIDGPYSNDIIAYTYDALGRPITRTVGPDTESFTYDSIDRVIGVNNVLGNFTYSYLGQTSQATKQQLANGFAIDRHYGSNAQDRRLTAIVPTPTASGSAPMFLYQQDAEGRVLKQGQFPGGTEVYTYDGSDRLVQAQTASLDANYWQGQGYSADINTRIQQATIVQSSNFVYAYDAGGNIIQSQGTFPSGATTTWTAAPNTNNQYASAAGNAWTYDAAGNVTDQGGDFIYTWDAQSRLVKMTHKTNGGTVSYAYDGLSRLASATVLPLPGVQIVTRYLWCGESICQTRNGNDQINGKYFDQGEVKGSLPFYYVRDRIGSVRATPGVTGAVNSNAVAYFGPYGEEASSIPNSKAARRYAGMHYMGIGGGYYPGYYLTHYRMYQPGPSRWMSRDPIEENGGLNLYAYVEGDPANNIDPTGRCPWCLGAGIGAAIGGIGSAIQAANSGGSALDIAKAAAVGAVTGAVAGAIPTNWGFMGAAIASGAIGTTGNVAGQLAGGKSTSCIDWEAAALQGAIAAGAGGLGWGAGFKSALQSAKSGSSGATAITKGTVGGAAATSAGTTYPNLPISTDLGGFNPAR